MRHYIGIDLDQNSIRAGIVDEAGGLIAKERIGMRVNRDRKANEIVRDIAYLTQKVIETSRIPWNEILAMGIGSPGVADNDTGVLTQPPDLPLRHIDIRHAIRRILPLPVYIENDSNCAALAESLIGAARGTEDSVTIKIGKDITGGAIIRQRIHQGFNAAAASLGHFVVDADGEHCRCGKNGCFVSYASSEALMRDIGHAMKDNPRSLLHDLIPKNGDMTGSAMSGIRLLIDAWRKGDKTAKNIALRYIHRLAAGLDSIACILRPEVIVLIGEICEEGDFVLPLLLEEADRFNPGFPAEMRTRIAMSGAGDDAGMIGAAMAAKFSMMDGIGGDSSRQNGRNNRF